MVFRDTTSNNLAFLRIITPKSLMVLWYLVLLWCPLIQINADQPLNFVIFVNHDHAVSAWGIKSDRFQEINPTRNIDSLGSSGYSFINAFCSNGSSAPGSATMLTGKFAHQHGLLVNGQRFNPNQPTLPKALKQVGYESALFGRWDLKTEPADFDHWEVLQDSSEFFNPTILSPSEKRQIEGHSTDIITDLLIQWIQQRHDSKKPFLAFVFFNATQRPWMPTLRQLETYNNILLPEPSTLFSNQKDLAPASRYQLNEIGNDLNLTSDLFMGSIVKPNLYDSKTLDVYQKNLARMNDEQFSTWQLLWRPQNEAYSRDIPTGEELLRWKYQRFTKNYLRCIKDVDENIGRFRTFYQNLTNKECIFIYTANQGRFVGENGWFGGQWMMESSMRIPLSFTFINRKEKPPKMIKANVQDIDIVPTILNLAGQSNLKGNHGIMLNYNDWNSTALNERAELYFHHYDFPGSLMISKHYGIRNKTHKLIHYYQFGEWELFDNSQQVIESINLIDSYSETSSLKERLADLKVTLDDQGDKSIMPEKWRRIYRGPSARVE
jgi:arylsulfatase A-like enzyme